jgi:hypothetical protein
MLQVDDGLRRDDSFDPVNADREYPVASAILTDRFRATSARATSPAAGPIAARGPRQQVRLENLECI